MVSDVAATCGDDEKPQTTEANQSTQKHGMTVAGTSWGTLSLSELLEVPCCSLSCSNRGRNRIGLYFLNGTDNVCFKLRGTVRRACDVICSGIEVDEHTVAPSGSFEVAVELMNAGSNTDYPNENAARHSQDVAGCGTGRDWQLRQPRVQP